MKLAFALVALVAAFYSVEAAPVEPVVLPGEVVGPKPPLEVFITPRPGSSTDAAPAKPEYRRKKKQQPTTETPAEFSLESLTGKRFVPKGQTPPAGLAADKIFRAEDAPSKFKTIRVVHEGDMMTMDARLDRLTLTIDDNSIILRAANI